MTIAVSWKSRAEAGTAGPGPDTGSATSTAPGASPNGSPPPSNGESSRGSVKTIRLRSADSKTIEGDGLLTNQQLLTRQAAVAAQNHTYVGIKAGVCIRCGLPRSAHNTADGGADSGSFGDDSVKDLDTASGGTFTTPAFATPGGAAGIVVQAGAAAMAAHPYQAGRTGLCKRCGKPRNAHTSAKVDTSAAGRRRHAKRGEALPDGSYPIVSPKDVENAVSDYGRAGSDAKKKRVKKHIIKRARKIGATDKLPDSWTEGGKRLPFGRSRGSLALALELELKAWDAAKHPRDKHGKFLHSGDIIEIGGGKYKVTGVTKTGAVQVENAVTGAPEGHLTHAQAAKATKVSDREKVTSTHHDARGFAIHEGGKVDIIGQNIKNSSASTKGAHTVLSHEANGNLKVQDNTSKLVQTVHSSQVSVHAPVHHDKNGTVLKVGDTVTGKDGKQGTVTGLLSTGEISVDGKRRAATSVTFEHDYAPGHAPAESSEHGGAPPDDAPSLYDMFNGPAPSTGLATVDKNGAHLGPGDQFTLPGEPGTLTVDEVYPDGAVTAKKPNGFLGAYTVDQVNTAEKVPELPSFIDSTAPGAPAGKDKNGDPLAVGDTYHYAAHPEVEGTIIAAGKPGPSQTITLDDASSPGKPLTISANHAADFIVKGPSPNKEVGLDKNGEPLAVGDQFVWPGDQSGAPPVNTITYTDENGLVHYTDTNGYNDQVSPEGLPAVVKYKAPVTADGEKLLPGDTFKLDSTNNTSGGETVWKLHGVTPAGPQVTLLSVGGQANNVESNQSPVLLNAQTIADYGHKLQPPSLAPGEVPASSLKPGEKFTHPDSGLPVTVMHSYPVDKHGDSAAISPDGHTHQQLIIQHGNGGEDQLVIPKDQPLDKTPPQKPVLAHDVNGMPVGPGDVIVMHGMEAPLKGKVTSASDGYLHVEGYDGENYAINLSDEMEGSAFEKVPQGGDPVGTDVNGFPLHVGDQVEHVEVPDAPMHIVGVDEHGNIESQSETGELIYASASDLNLVNPADAANAPLPAAKPDPPKGPSAAKKAPLKAAKNLKVGDQFTFKPKADGISAMSPGDLKGQVLTVTKVQSGGPNGESTIVSVHGPSGIGTVVFPSNRRVALAPTSPGPAAPAPKPVLHASHSKIAVGGHIVVAGKGGYEGDVLAVEHHESGTSVAVQHPDHTLSSAFIPGKFNVQHSAGTLGGDGAPVTPPKAPDFPVPDGGTAVTIAPDAHMDVDGKDYPYITLKSSDLKAGQVVALKSPVDGEPTAVVTRVGKDTKEPLPANTTGDAVFGKIGGKGDEVRLFAVTPTRTSRVLAAQPEQPIPTVPALPPEPSADHTAPSTPGISGVSTSSKAHTWLKQAGTETHPLAKPQSGPDQQAKANIAAELGSRLNNEQDWQLYRQLSIDMYGSDPGPWHTTEASWRQSQLDAIASTYVQSWAGTSGDSNPQSLSMQMATRDVFSLDSDPFVRVKKGGQGYDNPQNIMANANNTYKQHGPLMRSFVGHMYSHTQEQLAAAGITEVKLHRGVGGSNLPGKNGDYEPEMQPINSWATAPAVAHQFGPTHMQATFPASRVLGSARTGYGCLHETEYVVMAGPGLINITTSW